MSYYQSKGIWNKKVRVKKGPRGRVSISSGVPASKVGIKWEDEKKSVRRKVEQAMFDRARENRVNTGEVRVMTFSEVAELYMDETPTYDRSRTKRIVEEFGDLVIDDISEIDIRRFQRRITATRKGTTWNRYRNQLNAIFNYAVDNEYVDRNPARKSKKFKDERVKEYLRTEHVEAILREAAKESQYLFYFVLFALKTGRRTSEILSLEWKDIDFKQKEIKYVSFCCEKG